MSYQDLPRELNISAAPFLARLTSVVAGTGAQAGLNLYGFVEQVSDPATGLPADANPGRTDNLQTAGRTYALEVDNRLVPGLTSTPASAPVYSPPIASPLPQPYAWLRLKGIVNGSPVYEFELPTNAPLQWIQIDSPLTSSSITLASGSITGYKAKIATQSTTTGVWSTSGNDLWFVGANSEVPQPNLRYQCRFFTNDQSGVAIWEQAFPSSRFSGAYYSGYTSQSLPNNAFTTLTMTGATGSYDTSSYTQAITLPFTGFYQGIFQVEFFLTGTSTVPIGLTTNSIGAPQIFLQANPATTELVLPWQGKFTSGNSIAPQAFQNSGAAITAQINLAIVAYMGS